MIGVPSSRSAVDALADLPSTTAVYVEPDPPFKPQPPLLPPKLPPVDPAAERTLPRPPQPGPEVGTPGVEVF